MNDTKKISDLISYLKRHAGAYVLPGWDGHNLAKLAEAALAANVPAGYKLVPVEPTPEMRKAFHCANAEAEEGTPLGSPDIDSPDHQWAAMLAAAPAPEAEQAPAPVLGPLPVPEQSACDTDYSSGFDMGYAEGWNDCLAATLQAPGAPAQAQQSSEPMTNIESPFNACQHREHCKGWKMVATDVVGRAKPEAQQPEYRLLVKGDVFKDGDECLLDDCKRWAPITPIFRGHPHMPGFHVPHRRPEAGIGASGEAL